jgi:ornithine--oxo-acid transaminase
MSKFRDKILMCPPDYFTVDYVINPWMAGHESSLDIKLARKQWKKLRDSLAEYADIVTIDPQPVCTSARCSLPGIQSGKRFMRTANG